MNNFVYCGNCANLNREGSFCYELRRQWYDTGQTFELKVIPNKDGCTFGTKIRNDIQ